MSHPYEQLPPTAFWRSAVADRRPHTIADLWTPKFSISQTDKIATFGSCFAQHISRSLISQNYSWFDAERCPAGKFAESSSERGYGIFSARTGNIYTAAALKQWLRWAAGESRPPQEVWEKAGRYFDPFRPTIEPGGFRSREEVFASRESTLGALRDILSNANCFIFTLGLTEGWVHRDGYIYAACPGAGPAGEFDATRHQFKNFGFSEVLADMADALAILRRHNERIRVLLTVSPVPLTATASGRHVLVATTYSKSVLRAVAGQLAEAHSWVDYFPSFEIITGAPFRSRFYESNLRSVTSDGVAFVMQHFFAAIGDTSQAEAPARRFLATKANRRRPDQKPRQVNGTPDEDVVCEEIMLEAFAPATAEAPTIVPDADAAKVCIVGNSHIAALRQALREGRFADPKMDIVFWGFSGQSYNEIRFEDGKLVHPDKRRAIRTSGGRCEVIDPRDFDAIVFVGANFKPGNILAALKNYPLPLKRAVVRPLARILSRLPTLEPIKHIVDVRPGRIFFVPWPLISESAAEKKKLEIAQTEFDLFGAMVAKAFADHGIKYLPQPAETIRDNKWTKREFSLENNFTHMNGKFGALILQMIRQEIGALPDDTSIPGGARRMAARSANKKASGPALQS